MEKTKEKKKTTSKVSTVKKETVKKVATKTSEKTASKAVEKKPVAKIATKPTTKTEVKVEKVPEVKTVEKTKVLYVASECHPFCATGGLADVAGGLPKYIAKTSNTDIRVMLPLYSDIPQEYRKDFKFLGNTNVPLSWRSIYCGVFSYELEGVTYYFLDNESYFKRSGIYSFFDDGERFAFTSRAVLEVLSLIDFKPEIIHCNDWQFALVPIYLKTLYSNNNEYNKIKTIFTLHNTEYQGKFDLGLLTDLFGIDSRHKGLLEFDKAINLVKGAVVSCDKFTTVSPSYAKEILSPEHSNGLHSIFKENEYKTVGIINGVDYDFYNPKTDKEVYKNFDADSFELKKENKLGLQKEFGLNQDENAAVLSIVTRMAKHKGLDLIKYCFEGFLNQNIQLIVTGNGDSEFENYFKYLENKYKGKVKVCLGYSNAIARKAYAGSDIFLMPSKSEPCGISQMIASRYGSVPVVRETGGLKDSIKDFGCEAGGNGYTFARYNADDLAYSIGRALNDYKDQESWKEKIKKCMNTDFSWNVSAKEYVKLYEDLVK